MTQKARATSQTPRKLSVIHRVQPSPVDAPETKPAAGNEALAQLRHALMQQVWDSTRGFLICDTLAVAHGILGNPDLLDALVAYRLGDEVLVEDSWFPRSDLPRILGNFMLSAADRGREWKQASAALEEARARISELEAQLADIAERPTK